jgi:hypothetical protein
MSPLLPNDALGDSGFPPAKRRSRRRDAATAECPNEPPSSRDRRATGARRAA